MEKFALKLSENDSMWRSPVARAKDKCHYGVAPAGRAAGQDAWVHSGLAHTQRSQLLIFSLGTSLLALVVVVDCTWRMKMHPIFWLHRSRLCHKLADVKAELLCSTSTGL